MEKLVEIEKATLKTLVELDKEMFNTPQETERTKRKSRRKTWHARSSTRQMNTTEEIQSSGITENAGIHLKTPVNRSCSVRKPLQVVSASRASSNISLFSRNVKSGFALSKAFAIKNIESVVKAKNPIVFTTPKPQRFSASNLLHKKSDYYEGQLVDLIPLGSPTSQTSASSSDDFKSSYNDTEKPFTVQKLVTSRKSKKLDFIVKESKSSRTGGTVNANEIDTLKSSIMMTKSSTSSPSISYLSSSNAIYKSSHMAAEPSTSLSTSLSPIIITKSSVSSCSTTGSTVSTVTTTQDDQITLGKAQNDDLPVIFHKLGTTNQVVSRYFPEESDEDDEFSKSVFSVTPVKKYSKASNKCGDPSSLKRSSSICPDNEQYTNKEMPVVLTTEKKKLKVSRRSLNSSRKALQEARLQGLKNELTNYVQDLEIGCSLSLTSGSPNAMDETPSPTLEIEVSLPQKSTPSPNIGHLCKIKLETPSLSSSSSSSSTNPSQGLESSTKLHKKDWMYLFEEPFPRRSPRLSSITTNTDNEYEYLMSNFSPLTSGRRSKRRRKPPRGSQKKNMTTSHDSVKLTTVLKDPQIAKLTVSPLAVSEAETSPSILQTLTLENDGLKKEMSLKRPQQEKIDKTILSKKKSSISPSQTEGKCYFSPQEMVVDLLHQEELHFPRPPAVLSCPRGPYSLIADFALPDRDFAKLKLAKIKESQAKKTNSKDYNEGRTSYGDSRGKHKVKESCVIGNNKSMDVGKETAGEGKATVTSMGDDSRSETGAKDEETISAIPTRGSKKKYALCQEGGDKIIPATQNTWAEACQITDIEDKSAIAAFPTRGHRKKGALCDDVEDGDGIIYATPKTTVEACLTTDIEDERAITDISTGGNKKKGTLCDEEEDGESIIPATPKTMAEACLTTDIEDERAIAALPTRGHRTKGALCDEVEDGESIIPATPKAEEEVCATTTNKPTDNLSEAPVTQYSDSENTLSGSILQILQVSNIVDTSKTAVMRSFDGSNSTDCFEDTNLDKSACLHDLTIRPGPEISVKLVKRISPEMSSCFPVSPRNYCSQKKQNICQEDIVKSSQNKENNFEMKYNFVNSAINGMKGNENGIKREQFMPWKEYVPSSQGSTASQRSPNELKGLLSLNQSVMKTQPIPVSSLDLSNQEQPPQDTGPNRFLDYAEDTHIPKANLQGIMSLQSESELHVADDSKKKYLQPNDEGSDVVLDCSDATKVCNEENLQLNQEKGNVSILNQAIDHMSNYSNTVQWLPLERQNDFQMVSAVNQILNHQAILDNTQALTSLHGDIEMDSFDIHIPEDQTILNKTLSFPHSDTEMGSPVNQVPEKHCSVGNIPSSFPHSDTEKGSPVNQVPTIHHTLTSLGLLHGNNKIGFTDNQENLNSECVQTPHSENPVCDQQVPFDSNAEQIDDSTPSIQGSVPLYSNPEECNEHTPSLGASFAFCPSTEEFSNASLCLNPDEFCCPESQEPKIGSTATPHGKASMPMGSSVTDIHPEQRERCIVTPVLMQACLQHENSESNEVLSISMWTYDIPGHVMKKRDVIAVCLSRWVVLWIKMPAQEWTVLKSWTLDNAQVDSEMFQMVKFLPVMSHLVLFVGGTFHAANSRIYGYSETTSYDFQLEHDNTDEMMPFHSMCILNDKEQYADFPDSGVEVVVAGATANGPIVTKWSLDCHCLDVKTRQGFPLPDICEAITSLCTVDGSSCLLIGSTTTHLLLWNFKSCSLLKEISLTSTGLQNSDCLQATTEMGLLFLTMCQTPATDKERFGSVSSSCLLYALNPVNSSFKCIESFPFKGFSTRCWCVSGQYLAMGQQDGVACLLNIAAPRHWVSFPVFQGAAIQSTSFHPNRPIIAFGGGRTGCVHLYSLS